MRRCRLLLGVLLSPLAASAAPGLETEVQAYLDGYSNQYQRLYAADQQAEWVSNTRIVEGDSTNAKATRAAKEALAHFTGSSANIAKSRAYLARREELQPLQRLQLEAILYLAGDNPQTVPDLVKQRIAAETAQTENLFGFDFKIGGKSVTPNDIDEILRTSTNLAERLAAWQAAKEVGKGLKDGLVRLRDLRNQTVQALGYSDYFSYQVSEYGMTTAEMMQMMAQMNRELRPLYRELHTYARYELAKKYGAPVPKLLPAHWLPNRWGQDWTAMVSVAGFDLDAALKSKTPEWCVKQAESFYVSLGFPPLPASFWELSSLYPVSDGASYKKNTHASAWHIDLDGDVRSLMSVENNAEWYQTTHHELGHIYYYLSYSNPQVPLLLRKGANRAYHEAIGSMIGLASMQKPFLEDVGLVSTQEHPDTMQVLLKEALDYVVFIPWSTGPMSVFEQELYGKNLPPNEFNKRWWELVREYQGIEPPTPRGEEFCDAATKTHINDDAAQYYDYALSYALLFQIHDHIAREILHQDPHATNYAGSKPVGDFLRSILARGASVDWRRTLRDTTGSDLGVAALVRYFEPLLEYLKKANAGREATLPEMGS